MRRMNKASVSVSLAVLLAANSVTCTPVMAAETSSEKEEVIYVMADAAGKTNGVYAVNIFQKGNITDYGEYSDLKILNTNDKIVTDGDKHTFSTDSEKVYCQGTMENPELPWNISINYYLDGKKYKPEELAGKSGKLKITFKITENKECNSSFYDSYALQAAFTLDTNLCKNISADGATTANVGSDKQLSYTILPGKGIDTSITADVADFEMDAVSINGIKLSMDIDVDKSEITDQVGDLTDGIEKVDDGAGSVYDGTVELEDGGKQLKDGSSDLSDGTQTLDEGIGNLGTGVKTLQKGLNKLNGQSDSLTKGSSQVKTALKNIQSALSSVSSDTKNVKKLTSASGEIKKAITNLKNGAKQLEQSAGYEQYKSTMNQNGVNIDTIREANTTTITALSQQISQLNASLEKIQGVEGYEEQAAQLKSQISMLNDVITLLKGNSGAMSGTEQYLNGISSGASELSAGLEELEKNYAEFDKSINSLADSLTSMVVNVSKLSDGINKLTKQYTTLDGGIKAYTEGVNEITNGYSSIVKGVSKLAAGSQTLVDGSKDLDNGVSDLYDGVVQLCDGAEELSDGTGELREETSDMDQKIDDKIDEIMESVKGKSEDTVSFVSEKNTNVDSVQFVIKTDAIEIPDEPKEEKETEEEKGILQKFVRLFTKES